ncbi:MAG: PPC domain-containing protein [Planctomycetes bacterium]|nr:PPC domain-containing protein [Planctomycetota bacterium]
MPATITGRIDPVRDEDVFRFQAKKGDKLIFRVESRALGFPLDPFLRLMDSSGKTLTEVDDSGGGPDAELAYSAPADGQYQFMIRDLHGQGGERYVYRLSAVFPEPDFSLKLAADAFTLTPGQPLEIPVTIERTNGFAEEIEITGTGLPDGVMASPMKSLGTGDSAKSVKLVLQSTAGPSSGPIRIIGRKPTDAQRFRTAKATPAGLSVTTADVWLTVLRGN